MLRETSHCWNKASQDAQCMWQGSGHIRRCVHKVAHTVAGAHTTRCIHKAGHTQGGLSPPHTYFYLMRVKGLAPAASKASNLSSKASRGAQCVWEGLAVHTQGGAYTRHGTQQAA